jgi:hypothetical protein
VGSRRILTAMQEFCLEEASDDESLKCWNLERIIETEQFGDPTPKNLSMDDLLCDLEEENDGDED